MRPEVFGTDHRTPDGTAIGDYLDVVGLADGHLKALERLVAGGLSVTLNVATGCGASIFHVQEGALLPFAIAGD